jgi:hypothetical protein
LWQIPAVMRLTCLLAVAAAAMFACAGCALRATTDFGPQSESARQSINAGMDGHHGVPLVTNDDDPGGR